MLKSSALMDSWGAIAAKETKELILEKAERGLKKTEDEGGWYQPWTELTGETCRPEASLDGSISPTTCSVEQSAMMYCVCICMFLCLEVATPTRRAFSGHGGHALTWRNHGHSVAA